MRVRRPSASSVIALLALFFALGGTAIAAKHYLITSASQIKPSVLKKLHGAQGSVGPQGTPGPAGPQGPAGAPGPSNLSALTTVEGPKSPIPAGKAEVSIAACPSGERVVSGGAIAISAYGLAISHMSPDHLTWIAIAYEAGSGGSIQAFAYCAGAGNAVAAGIGPRAAAYGRAVKEAHGLAERLEGKISSSLAHH